MSGGDPGYTETAMMLSESAMSLAFDDNPPSAGQVTTAVAMGDNLIDRLLKAGHRLHRATGRLSRRVVRSVTTTTRSVEVFRSPSGHTG